jgi:signal transduction histidine kinase
MNITDDGICDLSHLESQKGNGIRNIAKRIRRNNGWVRYFIQEGQTGLTIEIKLPIL